MPLLETKETRMQKTALKPSRFNTQTNWERIKKFMLRFRGDIVLNEDHRVVIHELCEEHGLVINLGQTSCSDEPVEQLIFCAGCINRGTIEGNRLTVSHETGAKETLDFHHLTEAPIE